MSLGPWTMGHQSVRGSLLRAQSPDTSSVSKFSPRPGTKAKELKQLDNDEIERRSRITSELVKKIADERNKALLGNVYLVLITEKQKKCLDFLLEGISIINRLLLKNLMEILANSYMLRFMMRIMDV